MEYELRFQSLRDEDEVFCFPCDGEGHTDMNGMDRDTLNNYLYARALVGIDFKVVRVRVRCGSPVAARAAFG